MKELAKYKTSFDKHLSSFLHLKIKEVLNLAADFEIESLLVQATRVALSGGKRFRPFLAHLSFKTFGGRSEVLSRRFELALELLHVFCLAHDDIIDKGTLRHGQTTVHELAFKKSSIRTDSLLRRHVANSQGMLIGDILLSWATGLAAISEKKNTRLASESFFGIIEEVMIGEMLDVYMATKKDVTLEKLDRRNALKTAGYSFVGPIKVGARLATGSTKFDRFAHDFGVALGTAYQIQDDWLDFEHDSGKSIMLDLQMGQKTHLTYYMKHLASRQYKKKFDSLQKNLSIKHINEIKNILHECGAMEFARLESAKYFAEAKKVLSKGPVEVRSTDRWLCLVEIIENRNK